MGELNLEQVRKLHAASTKIGRIRKPTSFEIGRFKKKLGGLLDSNRPKIHLMLAIQELTESPAFSWFAASGVSRMLPSDGGLQSAPEHREEAAISSMEFLFRIVRHSPENACRAALSLRTLEGCQPGHILKFFTFLNSFVDRDHPLALHVLGSYSCSRCGPSLLGTYTEVVSFVLKKGGEGPAREFASLFSKVAAYPESAGLMLDSIKFTATHLQVEDWANVISSVREEWERALQSDVFRKNPD